MIKKAPSKSARVGGIPIPLIANLIMMIPMTIKSPFEIRSTGPWAFLECMNSVLAMTKNKIYLFLKLSAKRFLHHAQSVLQIILKRDRFYSWSWQERCSYTPKKPTDLLT